MHSARIPFLSVLAAALLGAPALAKAQTQASGVNLTVDEGFGARQQGMGLTRAGFQDGADAVVNAPASMNDVDDFTFSTTHLEQFGDAAHFDNAAVLIPWHADATLGLALARYAVSGIELRPEGDVNVVPAGTFTTADWLIAGSLARRFGSLDVGATVDLLYRDLGDQVGLGLRADGMAEYTFSGQYRAGVFISGLVPATAAWEGTGTTEYELPDASAFVSGRWPFPYFYGDLQASLETPGLFEKGARSANGLEGDRAIGDPVSLLKTSKLGAEFRFNFGLCLRAGVDGLNLSQASSSLRLGAGYGWKRIVGIDYAFSTSPDLGESYRVALWWTPSFPRFEGRHFRPQRTRRVSTSSPPSDEAQPQEQAEPEAQPGSVPQIQGIPPPVPQSAAPSDSSKGGQKEILEDN